MVEFPEEQRRSFIDGWLRPGTIVCLYTPYINKDDKNKYFFVASVGPTALLFIINTGMNAYVCSNEYLAEFHISLDLENHKFMRHDSHIDCTEIHQWNIEALKKQLIDDASRAKGPASANIIENVKDAALNVRKIEQRFKKIIRKSL